MDVDLNKIAGKWQKKWEKAKIFESKMDKKKEKYYVLEMFPYPSGNLHMGHVRNYSIGDAIARFRRMQGYNVLYPMGFDAFGLPAENAAIDNKSDPQEWTFQRMDDMTKQLKELGFSYDWGRKIATCMPEYYKWNQWIFLKLLEKKLAYKQNSKVNWCNKCKTVLANEQVVNGKCWRHENETVIEKDLEQWFFKITQYGDELLEHLEKLKDWPTRVKTMQKNWIGKSHGLTEYWQVDGMDLKLSTFTTMPHTTYGASFMVIAPEHPIVKDLVKGTKYEKGAKEFIEKYKKLKRADPINLEKDKNGYFLGKYVINHLNERKMPLYIANFAILEYGTGIVKCTPTHDQRDFEFAKKYGLGFFPVINPRDRKLDSKTMTEAYTNLTIGKMVNAGKFTGMDAEKAKEAVADYAVEIGHGEKTINYKLRDWLISRQRFWGTPIPIIYCDVCGMLPVPEKDLPVKLPDSKKADFSTGGNPLETVKEFVNVKCPKCGKQAKRETDTMDTFVDSSWYFLRFTTPQEKAAPFEKKEANYWMPVNQYIGGIEHAILHLLYARFFHKVLRDEKLISMDEPFDRLLSQGMVLNDGAKMSKSLGNTVDPSEIMGKYGPDTIRIFMLFASHPESEVDWSDKGVEASHRFLRKIHLLFENNKGKVSFSEPKPVSMIDRLILSTTHSTIKKVTEYIKEYKFNYTISSIMNLVNLLHKHENVDKNVLGFSLISLAKMLAPFTPHLSEELFEMIKGKGFIATQSWPEFDEKKIDKSVEATDKMIRTIKEDVSHIKQLAKIDKPKKVVIYTAPKWKWSLMEKIISNENPPDFKDAMKVVMADKEAQKNSSQVQGFLKVVLQKFHDLKSLERVKEFELLSNSIDLLEKELGTKVEVINADETNSEKAKKAFPLKPAILIE